MRVAPPVQALSCAAGPWRLFQQLLSGLSAAVAAGWAAAHLWGGGTAAVAGAAALGIAVAWALGRRRAEAAGRLVWDGAVWALHPPQGPVLAGQPQLMIDLGGWVLVRFMPGARWLPLWRRDVSDWQALRVALHAVPPPQPGA